MNNLVFRRQFILTNHSIQVDASWTKNFISRFNIECTLYSHPDLSVTHVSTGDAELFLLGYVLDPFNPGSTNLDILHKLSKKDSFSSIAAGTETLSGRYALIYLSSNTLNVLHDATGFREVFYYNNNKHFACGSTSTIISKYLNVERDDDKELLTFYNSPQFNAPERRWIGSRTIFKGIRKLLPNHYVDLLNNKAHRFWPVKPKTTIKIDAAVDYAANILEGTFDAIVKRYTLYQTLTAGWDTRLLLAACKKHTNKINFYFNRGFKSDAGMVQSLDYLVTKEIAEKNKLRIEFVEIENLEVDKEFERIYYSNNVFARPKLLKIHYNCYLKKRENCITVSGTEGNALLRLKSSLHRDFNEAKYFAKFLGDAKFPFILNSIEEWLEESRYLKKMNYMLTDLFWWEQILANWGALSGSEQDIVWDELRPYNNRALIFTFNSLSDKYRYKDYPISYFKIIKKLWPELLDYEIETKHQTIKKVLRTVNLEQLADKILQRIKAYSD